jgi:hypothetical protein
MSRPTLEVADIVRATGNRFWEKHKSHLSWLHRKVLNAIVRCRTAHWAVIAISASAAAIRSSRTTHAVAETAPSARATRAPSGWPRVRVSCCPYLTSTSSSPCRTSSPPSSFRTSGCSMICSSAPAPLRCSNLLAIPSTSGRTLGFSACSIPGGRTSSIIPMFTHRSRWGPRSRWFHMDRVVAPLLPARQSTQPGLLRQVLRATP